MPFHFYAPDVFQGVNSASAAMLSLVPKAAGFAALVRVLPGAAAGVEQASPAAVQNLLAVLAVATMTIGNLLAVRQHNLHRLLAYSSIAHSGYMLVGLAMASTASTVGGVTALWFYLATYGLVTVGVFALLAAASAERPAADRRRPRGPEPDAPGDGGAAGGLAVQPHGAAADGGVLGQAEPVLGELVVVLAVGRVAGQRDCRERGHRGVVLPAADRGDVPRTGVAAGRRPAGLGPRRGRRRLRRGQHSAVRGPAAAAQSGRENRGLAASWSGYRPLPARKATGIAGFGENSGAFFAFFTIGKYTGCTARTLRFGVRVAP